MDRKYVYKYSDKFKVTRLVAGLGRLRLPPPKSPSPPQARRSHARPDPRWTSRSMCASSGSSRRGPLHRSPGPPKRTLFPLCLCNDRAQPTRALHSGTGSVHAQSKIVSEEPPSTGNSSKSARGEKITCQHCVQMRPVAAGGGLLGYNTILLWLHVRKTVEGGGVLVLMSKGACD